MKLKSALNNVKRVSSVTSFTASLGSSVLSFVLNPIVLTVYFLFWVGIAFAFAPPTLDLDDVIQTLIIGLANAAITPVIILAIVVDVVLKAIFFIVANIINFLASIVINVLLVFAFITQAFLNLLVFLVAVILLVIALIVDFIIDIVIAFVNLSVQFIVAVLDFVIDQSLLGLLDSIVNAVTFEIPNPFGGTLFSFNLANSIGWTKPDYIPDYKTITVLNRSIIPRLADFIPLEFGVLNLVQQFEFQNFQVIDPVIFEGFSIARFLIDAFESLGIELFIKRVM